MELAVLLFVAFPQESFRLTAQEPNATYVTINLGEIYITDEIQDKAFGLDGYLEPVLAKLKMACEI